MAVTSYILTGFETHNEAERAADQEKQRYHPDAYATTTWVESYYTGSERLYQVHVKRMESAD